MTRVKISAAILMLLVGVSIFSGVWVNHRCGRMLDMIEDVTELSEEGDTERAAEMAIELDNDWEDFHKTAAVLIKYDKLTEVDRMFSRVVYLVKNENDDLLPELRELSHMVEMLRRSETPMLTSVL